MVSGKPFCTVSVGGMVTVGNGFTITVCNVVSLHPVLFVAIVVIVKVPAVE